MWCIKSSWYGIVGLESTRKLKTNAFLSLCIIHIHPSCNLVNSEGCYNLPHQRSDQQRVICKVRMWKLFWKRELRKDWKLCYLNKIDGTFEFCIWWLEF